MRLIGVSEVRSARGALLVALLLGSCLIGCASSSDTWTKPGVTEQERGRDTLDCLTEARRVTPGPGGPVEQVNQDRYRRCMTERGYTSGPSK